MRRVVTEVREDGKSYIARVDEMDADSEAIPPDTVPVAYPEYTEGKHPGINALWGTGALPFHHPVDVENPPTGNFWETCTNPTGLRVSQITYYPGHEGEFFWTQTTDFIFIVSGELTCVVDSGDEIVLRQGDLMVQNGTNKAWFNRGTEPAVMACVMTGTVFDGPTPPPELRAG
jgi:uncharacterized cupin superfamily protein